jgi:hypothetical protein
MQDRLYFSSFMLQLVVTLLAPNSLSETFYKVLAAVACVPSIKCLLQFFMCKQANTLLMNILYSIDDIVNFIV